MDEHYFSSLLSPPLSGIYSPDGELWSLEGGEGLVEGRGGSTSSTSK